MTSDSSPAEWSRRELLARLGGLTAGTALLAACRTLAPEPVAPAAATAAAPTPPAAPEPAPAPAATRPAALLPAPDLADERVVRSLAGIRPWRRGGPRIEVERLRGKLVVHGYGHGGAGITLAWGTADELAERVAAAAPRACAVAVLGAGVCGLTAAHRLLARGHGVRVLARELPPETTSDRAGGQWAPSFVGTGRTAEERRCFERIVRRSHAAYTALEGAEWGVFRRPNYATQRVSGLERAPRDLVPLERIERLPLPGPARSGLCYHTLLVEPPAFLARLVAELGERGAVLERRTLGGIDALSELEEDVVVDCLGLGAADVFGDLDLVPVRGQLVHLEPQDLPYLLSHGGYLFPRRDALVLGGSFERGVRDATPDPATSRRLLAEHRRFFAG